MTRRQRAADTDQGRTRPMRSRRLAVGLAAVLLAVSATPTSPVAAQTARSQRDQVRRQQAELASQVDAAKADQAEVRSALNALQANVAAQEAALADARFAAAQARAEAQAAAEAQAEVEAEVSRLRSAVEDAAVQAYVRGSQDLDADDPVPGDGTDPNDAITRQFYAQYASGRWSDSVEALRGAVEDLTAATARARDAVDRADQAERSATDRVNEVTAARDQQAAFAQQVDDRLNSRLAEAAALAEQDQALSSRIAAEEAAVAAAAARARSNSGGGGGGGGGGSTPPRQVGNVSVTTVRGITVATSIAGQLERMLAAAQSSGITLSGYGYRDTSRQVELRRQNCGTSDFAVYQMSPSACRPPTAVPGASMHEQGLAIDFRCNGGGTIQSRSSPCFVWLANNAASYGFYNLPSEPWHWSTSGR